VNKAALQPPPTQEEGDAALMICGINASARDVEETVRVMRFVKVIPKGSQSAIIPSRRDSALRRIEMIQTEMGRMQKLLDELRADVLHQTIE
jgi:hypothetical protein